MNRLIEKCLLWSTSFMEHRYLRLRDHLQTVELSMKLGKCGRDVHFYYPCDVTGAQSMEVGDNVHINRGALIRAEGTLKVGDNVHIGQNLVLYTINHNYLGQAVPYDHTIVAKPVIIEKNVWIGVNVTVIPGVTIGEGAIVGAGTVVSCDIPPLAIVGSAAPRILKYRDRTHYRQLDTLGHYAGINGHPYKVPKP